MEKETKLNAQLLPQQILNLKIIKIQAFDCQTNQLQINLLINGKHCFLLMELQNGIKVRIQRTQYHFDIRKLISSNFQQKNIFLIGQSNISLSYSVLEIFNFCNKKYAGVKYNFINNNCYHFLIALCCKFEVNSLGQKIKSRKKYIQSLVYGTFNYHTQGQTAGKAALDTVIGNKAGQTAGKAALDTLKAFQFTAITPLGIGITMAAQTFSQVMDTKNTS